MPDAFPTRYDDAELRLRFADISYKLGYLCAVFRVDSSLPLPAFRAQVRELGLRLTPCTPVVPFPPAPSTPASAPRHESPADA